MSFYSYSKLVIHPNKSSVVQKEGKDTEKDTHDKRPPPREENEMSNTAVCECCYTNRYLLIIPTTRRYIVNGMNATD